MVALQEAIGRQLQEYKEKENRLEVIKVQLEEMQELVALDEFLLVLGSNSNSLGCDEI